jgi:hypothetical protein
MRVERVPTRQDGVESAQSASSSLQQLVEVGNENVGQPEEQRNQHGYNQYNCESGPRASPVELPHHRSYS